jgi:DNA uptake protein ComE-like DNA-binding protein
MFARLVSVLFLSGALFAAPWGQATATKKATAKPAAPAKAATPAAPASNLVDINTASADELDALPGIGKAYSKKIIDNRPYSNKSQLVSKNVLPQSVYNGVKDRIVAKQKK